MWLVEVVLMVLRLRKHINIRVVVGIVSSLVDAVNTKDTATIVDLCMRLLEEVLSPLSGERATEVRFGVRRKISEQIADKIFVSKEDML